jgi:hypothetical protein
MLFPIATALSPNATSKTKYILNCFNVFAKIGTLYSRNGNWGKDERSAKSQKLDIGGMV